MVQYLYATKWKKLNSINDEFLMRFANLLNLLLTMLFLAYTIVFGDYIHMSYIICTGNGQLLTNQTLDFLPIWRNVLVVFHTLAMVKTCLRRQELSEIAERTQLFSRVERALGMKFTHPALDYMEETFVLCLAIIILISTGVRARPNLVTVDYVVSFRYFLLNTFLPAAISIGFPLTLFWRKEGYRKSVLREMKMIVEDSMSVFR